MRPHFAHGLAVILAALALLAQCRDGRSCDDPKADTENTKPASWPPPISAQAARTWIKLHETTIRPLPDRTPLRDVLRALRDATHGKDGKGKEIDFRITEEALWDSEVTLDAPVASPFVGQPEVSVDSYLKYLLHQFVWERYVHDGFVIIDSPCDDCEGYATVSAAEAHAWLLLHQVVPLKFPEKTPLGEILKAMSDATKGGGFQGRGLTISAVPRLLRDKPVWSKPVTIVAENAPIGATLARVLQPLGLAFRVLSDGNVLVVAATPKRGEADDDNTAWVAQADWDDDFPMYRSTYSGLWHNYVQALHDMAEAQRRKEPERAARARP
jgi:hypothetical protein